MGQTLSPGNRFAPAMTPAVVRRNSFACPACCPPDQDANRSNVICPFKPTPGMRSSGWRPQRKWSREAVRVRIRYGLFSIPWRFLRCEVRFPGWIPYLEQFWGDVH